MFSGRINALKGLTCDISLVSEYSLNKLTNLPTIGWLKNAQLRFLLVPLNDAFMIQNKCLVGLSGGGGSAA